MPLENEVDLTLWEPLPDIPHVTEDFRGYAVASIRDTLYISGGSTSSVHKGLLSFNMITRQWTSLPDMIYHRWGHRMAVLEGGRYLFAMGGWGYKFAPSTVTKDAPKKKKSMKSTLTPFRKVDIEEKVILDKLTSFEVFDTVKQVWKEAGSLNESRRDFAMCVDPYSGKIYAFGGTGPTDALSSVEVYNPHDNKWKLLSPMPETKRWCHAVPIGSFIYLFETGKRTLTYSTTADTWTYEDPRDAYVPKCPPHGKVCASAAFARGDVVVYGYPVRGMDGFLEDRWMITHIAHKRSKSWTTLPPADEFMYYRTAVANGKLVITTGNTLIAFQVIDESVDDNSSVASSKSTCSESMCASSALSNDSGRNLDPIKDDGTWKRQPDITSTSKPQDFRGYAVASAGNYVYISGGCSGDGTIYRSFLRYSVVSKKWIKLPGMTHRRLGHRLAITDDGRYLYAIGGGDGKTLRSMGVDIYDVELEVWRAAPSMNNYRVFFGYTICNGKIFVFGGVGSDNGNQLSSVEVFDPKLNGWSFSRSMPESRGVCNVITIGHVIYVFGTPSQKVLAYDTIKDEWLEEISPAETSLPTCPPGGCVCASSSFDGGEVLVLKYPLGGPNMAAYRRTAHVYFSASNSWSSVHLLDDFACYSAVVAGGKVVVVTPQNQLQACRLPRDSS